jgi:hypothetical protein
VTRNQTPLWLVKSRCAAIGAAIVVTFGLGGMNFASATVATGERNVFVPVVPCRLFDTRPAPSTVGTRSTPIANGEQFEVAVRGLHGDCNVSPGATAVVLNVTALDARGDGFLTVWPAENQLPITSNLNFSNGQAPVANAVTVKIDSKGAIKFQSSATSLNVIADVVGYFENHNHADAYKPGGTVLGTTVVPPTTTTVAVPSYDVTSSGNSVANGARLKDFLSGKTNRTVTVGPGDYYIGAESLTVPPGIILKGASRYTTTIIGDLPLDSGGLPVYLPVVILSADSTLTDFGVGGTGRGAGVQANTVPGATARMTRVSIGVSANNGAVLNNGSGDLVMTDVRTRSGFGVNNGSTGETRTGRITIQGSSDIDAVVQNAAGGEISVQDSVIGLSPSLPLSGVTAYKTGRILLKNVTVHSLVGVWATDLDSYIYVEGGSILSQYPRQADPNLNKGTTICNSVANPAAPSGFLSGACT